MPRSGHLQIRCRLFAALPISLDVVRDLHALREAVHTGSLNSADVDEHVLAALIRLNKPVALGLVEPFHSPSSHVESPLRLLRTGSMMRFGWGVPRTHKPVISLSAPSRNCRPTFGIHDACQHGGEPRAGMGEPKRADPNFKDHTAMVKCAIRL